MITVAALALGVFLVVVGTTHFLVPRYYRTLVPAWIPAPGAVVAATGAGEIVIGVLILMPPTRALGGWAAAVLITAYLASHLDAARGATSADTRFLDRPAGVAARVVVNVGYIGWAVAVGLGAPAG